MFGRDDRRIAKPMNHGKGRWRNRVIGDRAVQRQLPASRDIDGHGVVTILWEGAPKTGGARW